MKKIIICMSLVIIAVITNQTWHGAEALAVETKHITKTTPKMIMPQPDFDFGKVLEGKLVTHAFMIENHGNAPLHIINVRTSCGCTTAKKPESVAPGAKESIVVQGNTNGYGGRDFNRTITVTTDDPNNPTAQLRLKGQVTQFALIEPRHVLLQGKVGDTLKAEATITPGPEQKFNIVKSAMDDRLTGKIAVSVTERDGAFHVKVVNLASSAGRYGGRITFETDHSLGPQLILYVRGRIVAE